MNVQSSAISNRKLQNQSKKRKISKTVLIVFFTLISIGQLFPLVWLFDFSLCKSGDLFGQYILKWPSHPQFHNYVTAWVDGKILRYFINSVIVNFTAVSLTVLIALLMGYAFTRMEWKFRKVVMTIILLGLMIPIHATLLPNYMIFNKLGISNSYLGLIIPYVAFSMSQAIFIMTGFMESIPKSIEESAVMDGCGVFRIIFQIILPLTKPAISTITIMTFLSTWNEFIMAATYLKGDTFRTLPFAVYNFAGQYASNYSVQFAVMALVSIPALVVYIIFNEHITKGIMVGAVKG